MQSLVSYGHVGNSAAVFPLQRQGHEVMLVPTVVFSNHTGYGSWGGPMLSGNDVRDIVNGIGDRGGLDDCAVILSGYQGGDSIGAGILDAVALTKEKNPDALYACDPVLGSADKGCFVSPEVQSLIRDQVVPKADIITPNQFELGFLTGTDPHTLEETLEAADLVRAKGPNVVLVTSVLHPDREEDTIEMVVVSDKGAWSVATPYLPFHPNGSGDLTAALFASALAETGDEAKALGSTAAKVFEVLEKTYESGERELQLIPAQEAFVNPTYSFEVKKIR